VTGTIINAAGIILGGVAGLTVHKQLSMPTQQVLKIALGALTIYVGLKLTYNSLGPGFLLALKGLGIVVLALMLGRLTGRLLHLQKGLNHLGQYAKQRMAQAGAAGSNRFSEGFITCTVLFCLAPIATIGAVQDGLSGYWQTLGVKAFIDGLAAMAFVTTFGWGVLVSVIPVVAYQGTIWLAARVLAPYLSNYSLLDSVNATSGLLVFSIALLILNFRKVEVADYLPSLAFAPLITWLWR